jgi:hypothetical protein
LHGDRFRHLHVADLLDGRAARLMGALVLFTGTAQRRERAGTNAVIIAQGAGDGQLAMLATVIAAPVTVGAIRLPARRRGTARTARGAIIFIIGRRSRGGCRGIGRALSFQSCLTGFLFRLKTGSFRRLFFSATIFFGATTLFVRVCPAGLFFTTAGFFERGKARFFRLAEELCLKLLAGKLRFRRTHRGRRLGRFRRANGLWRGGRDGRGGFGNLRGFALTRLADHTAPLDLNHHGV